MKISKVCSFRGRHGDVVVWQLAEAFYVSSSITSRRLPFIGVFSPQFVAQPPTPNLGRSSQ